MPGYSRQAVLDNEAEWEAWRLLGIVPVGALALAFFLLDGHISRVQAFGIAFGIWLAVSFAMSWWWLVCLPRQRQARRRAMTLAGVMARQSNVSFRDGSVSDFAPEAAFLLKNNWALAFDSQRQLGRVLNLEELGRHRVEMDWLWGFEEMPRFEVYDEPRGLWRRYLGLQPHIETMLAITSPEIDRTLHIAVSPGFETVARRMAGAVNKATGGELPK
jgi:hypothetical protein